MRIGKIIKEERAKKGLTQEQLAQQFFVTRQLISKWENEKSYPDLDQVVKLSDFFDLPLDYLLKEDTAMVKELSFDTKRKRLFKVLLLLLCVALISVLSIFGFAYWIDGPLLSKDDITITKVQKKVLPEKVVTNQATGQQIVLPEDIEYTIYFTTDKPFIKLSKISGYENREDKEGIQAIISASYSLFDSNRESKIIIRSRREEDLETPELHEGKGIYLYSPKKSKEYFRKNEVGEENVRRTSDLIVSWKEIEEME